MGNRILDYETPLPVARRAHASRAPMGAILCPALPLVGFWLRIFPLIPIGLLLSGPGLLMSARGVYRSWGDQRVISLLVSVLAAGLNLFGLYFCWLFWVHGIC